MDNLRSFVYGEARNTDNNKSNAISQAYFWDREMAYIKVQACHIASALSVSAKSDDNHAIPDDIW